MEEKIPISKRLEAIAGFLHKDSSFADIGTDHAYLPCFVCMQHSQVKAIAGEVNQGPFERAKDTVLMHNLADRIDVRLGNGLKIIRQDDIIDTITIAGMGGALITSILSADKDILHRVSKIIAQPNNHAQEVRRFFSEHNYGLIAEQILEENGHIYEIVVGEKHPQPEQRECPEEMEKNWLFGPELMKEKSNVFVKKWQEEHDKLLAVIGQMKQARVRDEQKILSYERRLQWIKEVLS